MDSFFDGLFASGGRLLILGFGKEGQSSYRYIRKSFPDVSIGIADCNPNLTNNPLIAKDRKLQLHLGEDYLDSMASYTFILKSPGIQLNGVKMADHTVLSSQTDLFLKYYGDQCIGITGTKGKSTTASMIHHILKSANKPTLLLGNIGVPAFDQLDLITSETIVVFELSAHQLEYTHHSPKYAVILNIFPEHLDYFNTYEAYRKAKLKIFENQKPGAIRIIGEALEERPKGQDMLVSSRSDEQTSMLVTEDSCKNLISHEFLRIKPGQLSLLGMHNMKNMGVAVLLSASFGINMSEAVHHMESFRSLAHRLELLGPYQGVHFYNDSISTVPESAIAAVKALPRVDAMILGGYDRGLDYTSLVSFLIHSDVGIFIFLGVSGGEMKRLFDQDSDHGKLLLQVSSMEEAVMMLKEKLKPSCYCLLSPAAASYDQFRNFEHRGDAFKDLVIKYFA